MKNKLIMLIAGEPSGDLHGANLMRDFKNLDSSLNFVGAGGKKMRAAGLEGITDMETLAIMGFKEVFAKMGDLKKAFRFLAETLKNKKPDCLILIDYPGFNLRMAKVAKKEGIPVLYYISPQVWAWGRDRIKKIKKYVDKMFVILPFEESFYEQHQIKAEFVGHPLLDIVKPTINREDAFTYFNFDPKEILIGILPGSRWEEVKLSLPIMLKACNIIRKHVPNIQFGVMVSKNIDIKNLRTLLPKHNQQFKLIQDKNYDFMNNCDLLLVNSGTATLETAILGRPMIIIYKFSLLSWIMIKLLVKISYFGLVNIIAGKKIVPEFFQFGATPAKIAKESLSILADGNRIKIMQENLLQVKMKLGETGASQRSAKSILEKLKT